MGTCCELGYMSFYCELELLYENLDYTSGVGPGINLFPEV